MYPASFLHHSHLTFLAVMGQHWSLIAYSQQAERREAGGELLRVQPLHSLCFLRVFTGRGFGLKSGLHNQAFIGQQKDLLKIIPREEMKSSMLISMGGNTSEGFCTS